MIQLVARLQGLPEQIGRAYFACHFQEFKLLTTEPLLHPQRVALEVPKFAKPLAAAHPQGRGRVRPNADWKLQADVAVEGLDAKGDARSTDDTVP